ncbi:hypothetical protein ACOSP7_010413 [Xanthoceras sorbifolium]
MEDCFLFSALPEPAKTMVCPSTPTNGSQPGLVESIKLLEDLGGSVGGLSSCKRARAEGSGSVGEQRQAGSESFKAKLMSMAKTVEPMADSAPVVRKIATVEATPSKIIVVAPQFGPWIHVSYRKNGKNTQGNNIIGRLAIGEVVGGRGKHMNSSSISNNSVKHGVKDVFDSYHKKADKHLKSDKGNVVKGGGSKFNILCLEVDDILTNKAVKGKRKIAKAFSNGIGKLVRNSVLTDISNKINIKKVD